MRKCKILLIVLVLVTATYAADVKWTANTELTAINDADILLVVDDVAGTPTSKKITVLNFFDTIDTSSKLAAIVTDETGSGLLVFGTSPTFITPALGTPASGVLTNATGLPISTGVSGLAANVATWLGTSSSANLAAALTNETGSGLAVFGTSPTFITPALGTPASGVATNLTGLPLSTGVTGTLPVANGGTGRVTGTTAYSLIATGTTAAGVQQTLANGATTEILVGGGAAALPVWTTATGTGAPVRATSPTLVTPALGTPTALVGTNITGTASGLTAGNVTTNANLTGEVTSVGNAATIADSVTVTGWVLGTSSATQITSPTLVTNLLDTTGAADMDYGSADVTDHTFTSDGSVAVIDGSYTFPDADGAASATGELQYDNTITGLDDGGLTFFDDDEVQTLIGLDSSEVLAAGDDLKVVQYNWNAGAGFWNLVAAGTGDMTKAVYDSGDSGGVDVLTVVDSVGSADNVLLVGNATGQEAPKTDAALTYNAGTGVLSATGFAGALTGAVTGAASGNLLNSESDSMVGTLTADGLTLGQDENITLGAQTLDHDGTDFVFSDSVNIGANPITTSVNIKSEPKYWNFNIINPLATQTEDTQVGIILTTDAALTITNIKITLDAAGNEVAGDLMFADAFIGFANATVINVCDTTSGVLDDSAMADGTIPSGKTIYFQFDSAPNTAITQMIWKITYDYD